MSPAERVTHTVGTNGKQRHTLHSLLITYNTSGRQRAVPLGPPLQMGPQTQTRAFFCSNSKAARKERNPKSHCDQCREQDKKAVPPSALIIVQTRERLHAVCFCLFSTSSKTASTDEDDSHSRHNDSRKRNTSDNYHKRGGKITSHDLDLLRVDYFRRRGQENNKRALSVSSR